MPAASISLFASVVTGATGGELTESNGPPSDAARFEKGEGADEGAVVVVVEGSLIVMLGIKTGVSSSESSRVLLQHSDHL